MSLFGLGWAAGTPIGEALIEQRERARVQRANEAGGKGFYVPADLGAVGTGPDASANKEKLN